jgi:hypothetical protein
MLFNPFINDAKRMEFFTIYDIERMNRLRIIKLNYENTNKTEKEQENENGSDRNRIKRYERFTAGN